MNSGMDRRRRNKKLKIARNIAIALVPIIIIGLLIFRLGTDAKSMLSEANTLKTDLKAVMTGVKERDVESAQNATLKLDNTVRKLDRTLSSPVWKAVSHAPFAGKYVKSVNTLVSIAEDASDNILKPALDVMDEYPLGDGFSVSTINAYLNLLEDIEPRIESMTTKMQTVKLPLGKTEMISEYTQMLTKLTAAYKENGEYLPLFRAFLGDGSDKLYLLAAQNSAEIRASGGFPGSMGTIRIEDGVLTIDDFKTVYDMISVNPPTEAHITDTEYLLFSGSLDYARDACYIPDFERVGEIWALAYESKNDEHIDGVISLTPVIIQKVLAYTGAVTLSDGTELNGDNATQMLQKDLYYKYLSNNSSYKVSNAYDYVDSLFAETAKIVMGKLVDDFDINRIADYSKIFTDGGKDRTILMWMEDETAESYVKAAGCSGALNDDPSNPEAGVFFSGANGSKLGWFVSLDTQIGDVTVNDDGSRTYDVTVTVSNDITRDDMYRAGNYIIGNYNGQVESYLHLFAPAGGTISDFETSNSMTMNMDEYHGLEVAYNVEFMLAPSNPVTVTYKVTTAPGVSTPLKISQTPTLQSYR